MPDLYPADQDLGKGHVLLQRRLPGLLGEFAKAVPGYPKGKPMHVLEVYRSDLRQAWLYGQGRTPDDLVAKGLDPSYARPGPIVTNAWSAKTSAHGHVLVQGAGVIPASCAVDLIPEEVAPWQDEEFWTNFIGPLEAICEKYGLRHFHAQGKAVWDKPHIQLIEWDDASLTLRV